MPFPHGQLIDILIIEAVWLKGKSPDSGAWPLASYVINRAS